MASRNIGNIYAELSIKDKLTVGLKRAEKSLVKFGGAAIKGGAVMAGALATGMLVGTKRAIGLVDAVGDLSTQTGIAVSDLLVLQRAFVNGGSSAEMADKSIVKMQKTLGGVASGRVKENPFESLGLSVEQLMAANPVQQFDMIGKALMKIQDPALRNAKAMEIFGKQGAKMTSVFGTLDEAKKSLGDMPKYAQMFVKEMDEANDIIGRLPGKADAFFVGFATGIINDILPGLRQVDEFEFTKLGQNFGRFTGDFVKEGAEAAKQTESILSKLPLNALAKWGLKKYLGGALKDVENQDLSKLPGVNLDERQAAAMSGAGLQNIMTAGLGENTGSLPAYLTKDAAERARTMGDAMARFNDELAEANANATGDSAQVQDLKKMVFLREKYNELIEAGLESGDALQMANDLATAMEAAGAKQAQMAEEESAMSNIKDIQTGTASVNSMQARGFGMGAENMVQKVDEQIDVLMQIRDELKKKKEVVAVF